MRPNAKITDRRQRVLARLKARRASDESGFTLVELLIVCVVTPLLVGGLSMALMAAFQLQASVSSRITDSGDAQVVTASYQNDVQSAKYITTQSQSSPECGSGTQLLGLESNLQSDGTFATVVSYVTLNIAATKNSPASTELVRQACTNGSLTPVDTTTLSYDITSSQVAPTVTCTADAATCATTSQWVSAQDILSVNLHVTEPLSQYQYTLEAVPAQSASRQATGAPIVTTTTTNCDFASPNTGTYAATLCFVNFALLNNSQNMLDATTGCLEVSVALPGNFTMYFCLSITGSPVSPVAFPTYADAFLGNSINGVPFYIGVTGDPALYQYGSGSTTTITVKNIVVDNPQGVPATGWEAVASDAETTDPGESISFNSDQVLNLLPNTPSSPEGDACNDPSSSNSANPGPGGTELTGLGTTTVTCTSTWQAGVPRTGTDMVWATTPSFLTTTMHGAGLQGMSLGLLLS
jgi:type II secretory pathway component PulJ